MLFRKMLRDMRLNKAQFLSILLMSFLGVFIYSGVGSEWNGLQETSNSYYEETNLADAWVYSDGFTDAQAQQAARIPGVNGVERRLTVNSTADFNNNPKVTLYFVEKNQISACKLIDGEEFSKEKDGVWLDSLFAKAKGLKVGDSITFHLNGFVLKKKILGTVMSPEHVYFAGGEDILPNHNNYGFGYLSCQAFPKEIPITYTDLLITTDRKVDINFENEVNKALNGDYSVFITRNSLISYMQFNEEVKSHKAVGKIFPIIFLAVAVLTISTTMARLVNNQRTQIGILKAIGFRRRRILFHYVSYGLSISLIGAAVGMVLGPFTLPYLFFGPLQTTFTLPVWKSALPVSALVMALLTVLSCTVITYLSCFRVLQDMPSESLRPKAPKIIKHNLFDRLELWKNLSFHNQWNLRDIFRCKGRSIMAIVGILGCTALLVCAFGMQDSMDNIIRWNYEDINLYETKLELTGDARPDQVNALIDKYHGEAIMEGAVELKAGSIKKSGELLVTDQVKLIQFVDQSRDPISLPKDSISISYKMADMLKVKTGDQISWHIYGDEKWITSKVGAIYRTPFTQGISMTKECFEKLGFTFVPTSVITSKTATVKDPGVSKYQSKSMITKGYKTFTEAMNTMVIVLVIAAVILAGVVIYNLGVLSFTERQRELSTLKVIGFKTKKLRTLLLTQNIWLTAVGIIPGIPIGKWVLGYIFTFLGDVFDFMPVITFHSYLYSIAGTFLISIAVNRLFSKRVKKIDMVSSLKGVE